MRRILCYTMLILSILTLISGCKFKAAADKEKPLIVATIYPYELILKQLVDTLCTVETLLPANASPHTWSPAPLDVIKLEQADVIVANGLGLETNLEKMLQKTGTRLILASSLIDQTLLEPEHHGHHHEAEKEVEHYHGDVNPHIWTNPELITQIVIGLTEELSRRFPNLKDALRQNSGQIVLELLQVENQIRTERNKLASPAIITLHDAFTYFFDYFDIEHVGSVQPMAGKDPAPQQLKVLADTIRAKRIKAIFIEPQMNPRPAEVLAQELGLTVLQYDDLGTVSGAETIAEFLWWNWNALKAGF